MTGHIILSSVLMGLLVVAVGAFARSTVGGPARAVPAVQFDSDTTPLEKFASSPTAWTVGFIGLSALVAAGVIAYVSSELLSSSTKALVGTGLGGLMALLFGGFLFAGIYHAVRSRGRQSAQAVGVAIFSLALVFLGGIVTKLVMSGA